MAGSEGEQDWADGSLASPSPGVSATAVKIEHTHLNCLPWSNEWATYIFNNVYFLKSISSSQVLKSMYLQQVALGQHFNASGRGEPQATGCSRRDDRPAKIHAKLVRPEKEVEKHTDAVSHRGLHIWICTIHSHKEQQMLQIQSFNLAALSRLHLHRVWWYFNRSWVCEWEQDVTCS